MTGLADEILHFFVDFEVLFQYLSADGLDIILIDSILQELRSYSILVGECRWHVQDSLWAEVEQLPSVHVFEELFSLSLAAWGDLEIIGDVLELSLSYCSVETQRIELEVACCEALWY